MNHIFSEAFPYHCINCDAPNGSAVGDCPLTNKRLQDKLPEAPTTPPATLQDLMERATVAVSGPEFARMVRTIQLQYPWVLTNADWTAFVLRELQLRQMGATPIPITEEEVKTRGVNPGAEKVVPFKLIQNQQKENPGYNMDGALRVLDELRAKIASGEMVCLTGVGISREDHTFAFIASAAPVSRLRMTGALAWVTHMFMRQTEGLKL